MRDERKKNKVMREERGERKEEREKRIKKKITIFVVLFTHVKYFGIFNTLCEWFFGI